MNDIINRANLPSVLNGVTMSECDKVIEPFLEERSCDEVWHTVRALRDFYDWVMSENPIEPNLILPERMERGEMYDVGKTITVMNHEDYMDMMVKAMMWDEYGKEPKHGKWKINNNGWAYCPECGSFGLESYNFCPYCGTKLTDRNIFDKGIDVPNKTYADGMTEAWKIAQTVFNSTVTLYEAIDVAKCMKGVEDETD